MFDTTLGDEAPLPQASDIAFDEPHVFGPDIDGANEVIPDGSRVELANHEEPVEDDDSREPPEPAAIKTPAEAKPIEKAKK